MQVRNARQTPSPSLAVWEHGRILTPVQPCFVASKSKAHAWDGKRQQMVSARVPEQAQRGCWAVGTVPAAGGSAPDWTPAAESELCGAAVWL